MNKLLIALTLFTSITQASDFKVIPSSDRSSLELSWSDQFFFLDNEFQTYFPSYTLEQSTDLRSWSEESTVQARQGSSSIEYLANRSVAGQSRNFYRLRTNDDLKDFKSNLTAYFHSPYFHVADVSNRTVFDTYVTSSDQFQTNSKGRIASVLAPPYFGVYDGRNGEYNEYYVSSSDDVLASSISPFLASALMGPYFGTYDAVAGRYIERYETTSPDFFLTKTSLNVSAAIMEPYFSVYWRRADGTFHYYTSYVTSLDSSSDAFPKLVTGDNIAGAVMDGYFVVFDSQREGIFETLSSTFQPDNGDLKIINSEVHFVTDDRDYYYDQEDGSFYYHTLSERSSPPVAKAMAQLSAGQKKNAKEQPKKILLGEGNLKNIVEGKTALETKASKKVSQEAKKKRR